MRIKRMLWIALGFVGLVLGAIGAVLPMLPAFPFLLLAAFSFGKSSTPGSLARSSIRTIWNPM